ncbi:MAG: histidine ammonia-lyase [Nitriliruptorales bacterium]|nr:histidine ammonia-lyase [Nitriliruptorales bacterium]
MSEVVLDGGALSPVEVRAVSRGDTTVRLGNTARERMEAARAVVERALENDEVVYGVTTGFGALANTRISAERAAAMQHALLRSHAAGVGDPLPRDLVRALLLLRARTLAQGHSGIRIEVVERYLDFLAADLLPVVPDRGSVGASGDLAPFAHLALPVIGEGLLDDGNGPRPASEVLEGHGLEPLVLEAKDGLSLLNGTEGMLAIGVLASGGAWELARAADIACAMSVEALLGSVRPFGEAVNALRPHPGQGEVAGNLRRLLEGSAIVASHHHDFEHAVQDAYSLRCAPQVHGAARDTFRHADDVFAIELRSVVDNPIVFPETGEVISAGNFHGQPLAFALDFMTVALTELGSMSERRTDRILDPERSAGLPPFLATEPGVDSGFMLAQYTAAALVAENRVLSHPASVESIPTSGSQEDHVSMGWGAGRKTREVLDSTLRVIAVELLCAAEGIRHRDQEPAPATAAALEVLTSVAPPLDGDRPVGPDIEAVAALISDGSLTRAVEAVTGTLA